MDYNGLWADYPDWWNPNDWVKYGLVEPLVNDYFEPLDPLADHNNEIDELLGNNTPVNSGIVRDKISDLGTECFVTGSTLPTGFTKHGINQMINRKVKPGMLLQILRNGRQISNEHGGITIVYKGWHIVLNAAGEVITIFPKK